MEDQVENGIELLQKPIVTSRLVKIGESVTERIEKLNLKNQVATLDTVKSLKKTRAELNAENKKWNDQFKLAINPLTDVVLNLKNELKVNITDKYKEADDILKTSIASVEIKVKEAKEKNVKLYFIEFCQSEDIDFVTFDKVGLEINLSTTEKAYKEKVNAFIQQIRSDVDFIKSMNFEAETMAEYKISLNASESIKSVKDRKERERQEEIRIKAIEQNRRILEFKNIGMPFDAELKTFNFNDQIYLSSDGIKDISKEAFANIIIDFDEKIKAFEKNDRSVKAGVARSEMLSEVGVILSASDCQNMTEDVWIEFYKEKNKLFQSDKNKKFVTDLEERKVSIKSEENEAKQIYRQNKTHELGLKFNGHSFVYKDINFHYTDLLGMSGPEFAKAFEGAKNRLEQLKKEENSIKKEPLKAPSIEEKLEIVSTSFEVSGTLPQLKALKAYMNDNNLTYKNIN